MANDVLGAKPTKEQIEEGLALLRKKLERDAKVASGELKPSWKKVSEMTPDEKAKYQAANKRYSVAQKIALRRAKANGLWPTDAEVDAEIAKG